MKLLPRYATFTGLQIGKQHLLEHFFPLPFTRYITLHAGSGMAAKNYPYFTQVVELLKPYLAAQGIEIVQLGVTGEAAIPQCHHTMGKTSMHQASYLLSRTLLHLGNDSLWAHRAGYLGLPLVALYGSTSVANHSPYQFDPAKTRFLESHRWGRRPTFAAQENPQSIATIDPYEVARTVLDLLGITHTITARTQFIGAMYANTVLEWIPNTVLDPNFNRDAPVVARMDKCHDENVLTQVLQAGRKVHLFAKQPIANLALLQAAKDSILSYSHELTMDCPIPYVRTIKTLLPKTVFFTRLKNGDELNNLRFHFLDHVMVEQATEATREDYLRESAKYRNLPEAKALDKASHPDILEFKTNKYVLSQNQVYLSHAHVAANLPTSGPNTGSIIDVPEFWQDIQHMMVYQP